MSVPRRDENLTDREGDRMNEYDGRMVQITGSDGRKYTGVAEIRPAGYCPGEYGREEEGLKIGEHVLFESTIAGIDWVLSYAEAVSAIPPGKYRHFKGNFYEVLCIARHSETTEPMVVYRALYGDGGVWTRPALMWNEQVTREGKTFPRFRRVADEKEPAGPVLFLLLGVFLLFIRRGWRGQTCCRTDPCQT